MKTIRRVLALLLCLALSTSAFASTTYAVNANDANSDILCFHIAEDVELDIERRSLNEQQIETIIDHLVGVREPQASTMNIICSVFGHDYETTIATITKHNVYSTYPKCVKESYDVSVCNRCEHSESVLKSTIRVGCCP